MAKFYAVKEGRKKGIYSTWEECKEQVNGYKGAIYKSFKSIEEAKSFIEEKKTSFNQDNGLIAYVDGSFNIKTKEYGYGCVIILGQKVICELNGKGNDLRYVSMRNVAGEILGSLQALKYASNHGYKEICIYYDYEGIEKWANGLWKANKEGTINYQQEIDKYRQSLTIMFIKVLAHSGDFYNERADFLAKKAVGINGKKD